MLIENEFTVKASLEKTWETLLDVPGVALCLPGARLTGVDGDNYLGKVKIKVGPVTTEYAGMARFVERDDVRHIARIEAKGTEGRGAGTASALIDTRLVGNGTSTTVRVSTDLTITGKVAQFGRGMIEEISTRLLGQFASNLEDRLAGDSVGDGRSPATTQSPAIFDDDVEPLDALALAGGSVAKRVLPVAAAVVLALVVLRLVFGRRRHS